jgi:hypothetical protein
MIASRTPEGEPNRCPVCGHPSEMEPSLDTRDATCPDCGSLLVYHGGALSEPTPPEPLKCEPLTRNREVFLLTEMTLRAWAALGPMPVIRGLEETWRVRLVLPQRR